MIKFTEIIFLLQTFSGWRNRTACSRRCWPLTASAPCCTVSTSSWAPCSYRWVCTRTRSTWPAGNWHRCSAPVSGRASAPPIAATAATKTIGWSKCVTRRWVCWPSSIWPISVWCSTLPNCKKRATAIITYSVSGTGWISPVTGSPAPLSSSTCWYESRSDSFEYHPFRPLFYSCFSAYFFNFFKRNSKFSIQLFACTLVSISWTEWYDINRKRS